MSRLFDFLISSENLNWAWRKARSLYRMADGIYDLAEVSAFELNLEQELRSIQRRLASQSYQLDPLILLPQPKKPDDKGNPQMRQSFHVTVRDQVAWIAIVNAIGPKLDSKMPPWSYGHRLYKAAWYETANGQHRLETGPYRHSNGQLYRRFKHSWPLFRRHVSLTARAMTNGLTNIEQLDASEKSALNFAERPNYLEAGYWPKHSDHRLYYASIDLARFYPSVTPSAILRGIEAGLDNFNDEEELKTLIKRMLSFHVGRNHSTSLGDSLCQPITTPGPFDGIPTGLMVAGFLSNIAMLPLDLATHARIQEKRDIAHFRFVDDHVILSYKFDDLIEWIRSYKSDLARFSVGPEISKEKYSPIELASIIDDTATDETFQAAKADCEINGLRPVKLMTKTLALVSELAGAGFEVMPQHAREQKLSELEWLLLANLPEDEIRADTRAAFAAGRIASLVPMSFDHSIELVQSHRTLAALAKSKNVTPEILADAKRNATKKRMEQFYSDRRRLTHYFKLILQAFHDHPDKPRLLIRALDYCRVTGHRGSPELLKWIESELENPAKRPLAVYLGPLAVQTISRHIATAAFDVSDVQLLERQRRAARSYLMSISAPATRLLLRHVISLEDNKFAGVSSRNALVAAVSYAGHVVDRKRLKGNLLQLAHALEAPALTAASSDWIGRTGSPIGVWANWLDTQRSDRNFGPGLAWEITCATHDPSIQLDRNSLRKSPLQMPAQASEFWSNHPEFFLKSDAGWLLDQQRSDNPIRIHETTRSAIFRKLISHQKTLAASRRVTLDDWLSSLSTLQPDDPRSGEWTALEIVRQLVSTVQIFPTGRIELLDELNPTNILLPKEWLAPNPPSNFTLRRWTWESWKQVVRQGEPNVTTVRYPISDFRRDLAETPLDREQNQQWLNRLRGVGLLLLGLCCQDFRLPASWNIRGSERDIGRFVKKRLEDATISSGTQGIIEAALLSRSAETALIRFYPQLFLGSRILDRVNDTASDPPLITDVAKLHSEILTSQETLERGQISVLNHAPRQLIPMNVFQLTRLTVSLDAESEDPE
ncbi:hypothetical protein [Tardiphaga sp.]|uniref:RNA-directed DNA polymerase n=1 Tax=Tardiphaga sp. TaxID=1926292 RepID=UPI002625B58D|nr:hypothetical protein [Tardiphaga sp.]MDB5617039.1 hypothetical protein [Tardiphaga sp.]